MFKNLSINRQLNGVTRDIAEVNSSFSAISRSSGNVKERASDLKRLAEKMQATVTRFRV
jgi:methyl-accepting chemotaxis protein